MSFVDLRVLIVDDNADSAELLAEALTDLGCATEIAHDGPSALEAATRHRPNVVFLDIGLPIMDGYDVARRLRSQTDHPGLKLIAVTGYDRESDRRAAREAGFDAHVVKPTDVSGVAQLLDFEMPAPGHSTFSPP